MSLLIGLILQAGALAAPCPTAGSFVQTQTRPDMARPLVSQGRFLVACERGFIWQTDQPLAEVLVFQRQQDRLVRLEKGEPTVLDNRAAREMNRMLNGIVSGDARFLEQQFLQQPLDPGVRLTPRNRRVAKFLQAITVRPAGAQEVVIEIERSDGASTRIAIAHDGAGAKGASDCQTWVAPAACAQLYHDD